MRLQMIGGGKMAEALLGGLVERGWAPAAEIHVVEPSAPRCVELRDAHRDISIGSEPIAGVDAVIAVKPDIVARVLPPLATAEPSRVLSIAAGVRTDTIEAGLPDGTAVVRCMPNTPALVGQGAAAIAPGTRADDDDLLWAAEILSAVGLVVTVGEADLDAVTGLSGSGPAYLFLLAEAMIAAGVGRGLPLDIADSLTRQTLLGAAALLSESGDDPGVLRANVTSPGGTTAAGLAVFDDGDLMGLVDRVITAATARSVELGGS